MTNFIGNRLQEGVYNRLTNDSELMALVNNIYDYLPKDKAMPYLVIGDISSKDFSTKTTTGQRSLIRINILSNKRGKEECQQIIEKVYDTLHHQEIMISGFNVINMEIISTKITFNNLVYQGDIELEILSEKI